MAADRFRNQLDRAQRAAQQGDLLQAEAAFRAVLDSAPKNAEAKFGLATVLAMSGRARDAIPLFRDVVKAKPEHLTAQLNLGHALLQNGATDEATQSFRAVLKHKPDAHAARYALGCALLQQGDAAQAESNFRTVLPALRNDAGLWINLATALRQLGRLGEAADAYRTAVQTNAQLPPAWSALGQTLLDLQQFAKAERAFGRAAQLAPQNADAEIGLGDALLAQQREDDALARYRRAIELAPQSQNAHTKMEALLLRMASTVGTDPLWTRIWRDRVYERPADAMADVSVLLDAYRYPDADALAQAQAFFTQFDPEQLYPTAWWQERIAAFGAPANGHDKILRGVCSALFSWSAPQGEAIDAVAKFVGDTVLHSFGAGTGYWEWLLTRHYGTRVVAGDQVLRHRFIDMIVEDYGTAVVREDETVFLAWIPRGVDAVMNLLQQMRPGQRLVLIGEGPDSTGKARICATETFFRRLETEYDAVATIPLGCYSYIDDDVRLYQRRG